MRCRVWFFVAAVSASVVGWVTFTQRAGLGHSAGVCGSCHIMRGYVDSFRTSNDMDSVHRRAGLGCVDCHTGGSLGVHAAVAATYLAMNTPSKPSSSPVADHVCNHCHVSMAYEATRTDYLTRNPHRSHWPELQCGDCHKAHGGQLDFCSGCHDNGGQRMTGKIY